MPYPFNCYESACETEPLTYEEVVEESRRLRRFLPPDYNMHAPQHLLVCYLYHQEGNDCHGCRYDYAGHREVFELAFAMWAGIHELHAVNEELRARNGKFAFPEAIIDWSSPKRYW